MTPSQSSIPNRVQTFAGLQSAAACREGFTILEVLISAGIMVIGLTCVAALLPAAAQRMSQAVSEDCAGTLAANAYADITARRSLGLFSASPGNTPWPKGESRLLGVAATVLANQMSATEHPDNTNLFASGSWEIQDALDFDESAGSPINTFDANNNRKTRANPMCWLATLVPDALAKNPVEAGDVAWLSIAVFKKQPSASEIVVGNLSGSRITIGGADIADDKRQQFVKGCGSVLALSTPPEWIRVNASWTDNNGTPGDASDDVTHVIVDPLRDGSNHTGNVVLFTNLLRVEKHRIVLD